MGCRLFLGNEGVRATLFPAISPENHNLDAVEVRLALVVAPSISLEHYNRNGAMKVMKQLKDWCPANAADSAVAG